MPFKISIVSDVKAWLAGANQVEDSVDDLANSLDDLARASTDTARDAGDDLEREFSRAFDQVKADAKGTGRQIGRDLDDGARRASDGIREFGDEAKSSAKEAAASFSGSADDIVDVFQEVAAQAFAGFGPAGLAAGIAAAAGIGLLYGQLEKAADQASDTKEAVLDLAEEIASVDGNPAAIRWAERLRETLRQIVDEKEWFEIWQDAPSTRLEEWSRKASEFGITMADVGRAVTGDTQAMTDVTDQLNQKYLELSERYRDGDQAAAEAMGSVAAFREELTAQAGTVSDATRLYGEMEAALSSLDDAAADSADATAEYQETVAGVLDDAGRSWKDYVRNGKVSLAAYNDAINDQLAAVKKFEANLTKAASSLSDEALGYLKRLGPEAAPLLQAFLDAPAKERGRTAAVWDKLGKATSDGYEQGADLAGATARALAKAQDTADGKPIKVETRLDSSGLQAAVDRAAAGIRPPTVTVNVKGAKTVI